MEFITYQKEARKTAIYPKKWEIIYPAVLLSEEVGELNSIISKWMRDGTTLDRENIIKEAGDVLWPLTELLSDLGIELDEVAKKNIQKLQDRAKRGVLKGSGDNR